MQLVHRVLDGASRQLAAPRLPICQECQFAVNNRAYARGVAKTILVVEDEPAVRDVTTRMLEQSILESAGFDVDVATSGEEGLVKARAAQYALFLVDVEMPGMDGFTFIERVRADPDLRNIPAVLVTSRTSPEDRQRGHDVGAQDYVVKSEFDQGVLLGRIRTLVA